MSPEQRWQRDQRPADADRVLVRDARGNPVWQDELPQVGSAADGTPANDQPDPNAPKFKFGDVELTEKEIADLLAHRAAEESTRLDSAG
jgi:hypothetical protein